MRLKSQHPTVLAQFGYDVVGFTNIIGVHLFYVINDLSIDMFCFDLRS